MTTTAKMMTVTYVLCLLYTHTYTQHTTHIVNLTFSSLLELKVVVIAAALAVAAAAAALGVAVTILCHSAITWILSKVIALYAFLYREKAARDSEAMQQRVDLETLFFLLYS
jgi:uncharacterized membrane protein YagU involved in acid resistance